MIQRIQTVYLLIVAIFMVLMMSFSVGHFYTETSVSDMTNLAVIASGWNYELCSLGIVCHSYGCSNSFTCYNISV